MNRRCESPYRNPILVCLTRQPGAYSRGGSGYLPEDTNGVSGAVRSGNGGEVVPQKLTGGGLNERRTTGNLEGWGTQDLRQHSHDCRLPSFALFQRPSLRSGPPTLQQSLLRVCHVCLLLLLRCRPYPLGFLLWIRLAGPSLQSFSKFCPILFS